MYLKMLQELGRVEKKFAPKKEEPDYTEKLDEFLTGNVLFCLRALAMVCLSYGVKPKSREFEKFTKVFIEDLENEMIKIEREVKSKK